MFDKFTGGLKDLKLSTIEGMFASIMFGSATIFIIPFAVFLGASSVEIGFLTAFPALFAAWFQLFSAKLLDKVRSRKKIVTFFVSLQAILWLPVFIFPLFFPIERIFWIILFYTAGTVLGAVAGPVWQSWMRALVPTHMLGSYFGVRNAICGVVAFLCTLGFGFTLAFFSAHYLLLVFALIFCVSTFGRLVSAYYFTKTTDPPLEKEEKNSLGLKDFIHLVRRTNFGLFIVFGGLTTFAISLIGPFFSYYLLTILGLQNDYLTYTAIIASASIAALLSLPYWGKLIDKHGNIKVLKATSFLLFLHPLTIILVRSPTGLIFTEFLNGIILAGFGLSLANFIYEVSSQKKLVRFASYQTMFFGTAAFFGLLISGFLQSIDFSFGIISNAFYLVCVISFLLRLIFHFSLINRIKEVRPIIPIESRRIVFGVLTFEPIRQSMFSGSLLLFSAGTKEIGRAIKSLSIFEKKAIGIEKKEFEKMILLEKKELENLKYFEKKESEKLSVLRKKEFEKMRSIKDKELSVIESYLNGLLKK